MAQGSVVDKCLMHLFTLLRESRGAAALLQHMPTPRSAITNALATVQSSVRPTSKAQTVWYLRIAQSSQGLREGVLWRHGPGSTSSTGAGKVCELC